MMSGVTQATRASAFVSLFASLGTLLCCALPSVLVLLGFGATVVSALSAMPWLVSLSRHKGWVFGVSGALIAMNAYYLYKIAPRLLRLDAACPPGAEDACAAASRFSRSVLVVSVGVYLVGALAAFLVGPVLSSFER